MAEHILDAFVTKFVLDRSDYQDGVKDIEAQNKRLREGQKKTFDDIEQAGKKTGESIKGITREVIGLGLAFMGAKSMAGFIKDLAVGAASADRFGQTLGMSVQKVWAWRQAMKSVGGEMGEGDAALQRIQSIKMGLQTGNVDQGDMIALTRLGVTPGDLMKQDAGGILQKLAGSTGKVDPQLQANLLQQIGLPQSAVYFIQKGQSEVVAALKSSEANAGKMEEAAKSTEKLQAAITELQTTIVGKLVDPLTTIADILNRMFGNKQKAAPGASGGGNWYDFLIPKDENDRPIWGSGSSGKGPIAGQDPVTSQWSKVLDGKGGAGSAHGGTRADRNNNPGNIIDSAFARNQPGYIGSDGRFARFASADHGYAAMEKLLGGYMKQGRRTISSIISKWAPASENNVGAYVNSVSRATGLGPNQILGRENIAAVARAMAAVEGHSGARSNARHFVGMAKHAVSPRGGGSIVNVGPITINTQAKNAAEIARTLPAELKRRGVVIRADRGIMP